MRAAFFAIPLAQPFNSTGQPETAGFKPARVGRVWSLASCSVLMALLLGGCSTTAERNASMLTHDSMMQRGSLVAGADTTKPTEMAQPGVMENGRPFQHQPEPASLSEERFDVIADKTPAQVFFNSLVHGTDINLLVHEDVRGEITLTLKSVTLREALQAVRDTYGFDFQKTAYGYRVLPRTRQTRIYPINYLNVNRTGRSGMEVSNGKMQATDRNNSSSSAIELEGRSSEVETRTATDFWQQLQSTLALMVGSDDGARVVVDVHAGMVIVNATPDVQAAVEDYLARAEISVQRQVLIEARILEVTLNDGFQSGINWSSIAAASKKNSIYAGQTSTALANEDQIAGIFSLNFDIGDITGAIELLQTLGDVKVLSSPRIATVNNQKAVIKVGSDEFFVTDVSTTTSTTTTTSTETPEIELTPFFSGIALDVTPQIGSHDEVILHVHPKVTEVVERVKTVELSDDEFILPLAFSTVRETDSIIRARSGQVVVIGGLIQNRQVSTEARVPLLGDIPILGWLFRQQRWESVQSELVILIQPRVIGSASPDAEVDRILKRFQPELSAIQQ